MTDRRQQQSVDGLGIAALGGQPGGVRESRLPPVSRYRRVLLGSLRLLRLPCASTEHAKQPSQDQEHGNYEQDDEDGPGEKGSRSQGRQGYGGRALLGAAKADRGITVFRRPVVSALRMSR